MFEGELLNDGPSVQLYYPACSSSVFKTEKTSQFTLKLKVLKSLLNLGLFQVRKHIRLNKATKSHDINYYIVIFRHGI